MTTHRHTRTGLTALAITVVFAATPIAAQAQQDLRAPDTRDAAAAATAYQDLRSPDARDATTTGGVLTPAPAQDLRSPDTRDVAERPIGTTTLPDAPATRIVTIESGGFEWSDAVIGAAGMLGLMLLLAGATVAWTRRRHVSTGYPMAS
jgi:hypothetical protein